MTTITITPAAEIYLQKLKSKAENQNKELRIEALDINTPYAEAGLTFVDISPEHAEDLILGFNGFQLFVDKKSIEYLENATIDIKMENLQTNIYIDTPNLQPLDPLTESDDLFLKINFILENEINPALASHGGQVKLIDITENNIALIQFSGGCQGCSQIAVTLQHGIKETLLSKIPEITDVQDITNHEQGTMPYF